MSKLYKKAVIFIIFAAFFIHLGIFMPAFFADTKAFLFSVTQTKEEKMREHWGGVL